VVVVMVVVVFMVVVAAIVVLGRAGYRNFLAFLGRGRGGETRRERGAGPGRASTPSGGPRRACASERARSC